jgi:hypothetical protein
MGNFQTIVEVPPFPFKTGYGKKNLFMGSCFTESIGGKARELKYSVELNPFGILYNPVSIANGLKILLEEKQFREDELFDYNGLWHSYYHHSRFSGPDKYEVLDEINNRIVSASRYLRETDFLFLTFGTARVYELKEKGMIVSNCHKIPSGLFSDYRLPVNEIVDIYRDLLHDLWELNQRVKVVFTVSPVRHWKDGAIENQRSKAVLLLAIARLTEGFGNERCFYFPSYEILMDELRDYRFYTEDMIHVSEVAVNYVWERFENALIGEEDQKKSAEILKVVKAARHRPFNRFTREHLAFVKHMFEEVKRLETKHPDIDFQEEKNYFCNEIIIIGDKVNRE